MEEFIREKRDYVPPSPSPHNQCSLKTIMSVWKVLGSVGIVLWGVRAFQVVGDILEYNDVVSYKSSIIQKIDSFFVQC